MTPLEELLSGALQMARGALADIATSQDMSLTLARRKANRIYMQTAIDVYAYDHPIGGQDDTSRRNA
jgi:hypothetical protein